jgi:hypothetical protein
MHTHTDTHTQTDDDDDDDRKKRRVNEYYDCNYLARAKMQRLQPLLSRIIILLL